MIKRRSSPDTAAHAEQLRNPQRYLYLQELNDAGLSLLDNGEYDTAIEFYNELIKGHADYALAYFNRAYAYFKKCDYLAALRSCTAGIRRDPRDPDGYLARGLIYYCKGRIHYAISDYSMAIELNAAHVAALNNRAIAYYRMRQYHLAAADLLKAVEHAPEDPVACYNLYWAFRRAGDNPQAHEYLIRAAKLGYSRAREILKHSDGFK
jgi:tetratricopeptide (TPR) repeat protein